MKSLYPKTLLLVLAISLCNCVNDTHYSVPEVTLITYDLVPNQTVALINADATSTPVEYTADDIIEAYVTSSDEKGTFYKSVSFQTIPTDGSNPIGFSIPLNATTLYGKGFNPGRKIYIKLKGLYTAKVYGSLQIGSFFENTIGRIPENEWQNHLFPSAEKVSEEAFVRTMNLSTAYTNANQNTLIELEDVQFAETSINRTYYDIDSGGGATNHLLADGSGGSSRIIRFSSFCPFTGNTVPNKNGKIRGVLTKYGSDYQFIIRYESDIKLNNPRIDEHPPIVGNSISFPSIISENFESYTSGSATTGQNNFPAYINDPVIGSKTWRCRTASSNKYIEMSSFGTPAEKNKALFIIPVSMNGSNSLSFKTKVSFFTGNPIAIYYSTDYVPGTDIHTATLIPITDNFYLSDGSNSAFNSSVPVGGLPYLLPNVGNSFIIFEYTGSGISNPALTTNFDIDDIVVN